MGDGHSATNFLAEWYLADLVEATVDDITTRIRTATEVTTAEGVPIRLVATLAVPSDEVLYGLFDAASSEAVVAACRRAGFPQQRLSCDVLTRFASGAA